MKTTIKHLVVEKVLQRQHFGHALARAHNFDGFIRLPQWKEDVFVYVAFPLPDQQETAPQLNVISRNGEVAWIPNMVELLSNDWEYHKITGHAE